ncbi:Peptidase C39 [Vibrio mytili]|uniref:type I secretion system permease/ATPase n=1 Tax=Vibrio mytili TaxID=50718 RepID=UPI0039E81184
MIEHTQSTSATDNQQDAWMSVVVWLLRHFELRHHPKKILSGLPLTEGKLDSELFVRACEHADLELTLVNIKDIPMLSFPVVAIEKGSQKPVIISAKKDNVYHVLSPNSERWEKLELTKSELQRQYEVKGWQIAVQPSFDHRVDSLQPRRSDNWLFSVVKEMTPWYRDLIIASLLINVLALVVPLFTMNVYDRVVPNQAFNTLWVLVGGVTVVVLFDWLLRKARGVVTDTAGKYIDNKLSSILFSKVMGMKLEHRPASVGAFARQLQDFDSVRDFFTSVSLVTIVDLPFTLLFLALIGWLGGPMMFIPVVVMLTLLILGCFVKSKIEKSHNESSALSMKRQAHLYDCLSSITEIKQHNATGESQKRWEQTISALSDWQNQSRHYSNIVSYSIQSSQQVITIALIVTGVYRISEGLLSMGGLIAIVMLSGRAASAVNQLAMLILRYQQTKTAIEGLNSIMSLPQETQHNQVITSGEFTGEVRLENVSFRYPDVDMPCLQGVDIAIKPGERIGIIGAAGAGKSTLMSLITSQLVPSEGNLYFDNVDSQLWPISLLRDKTGWVGQQVQLVYGSVMENIVLGHDTVDQEKLSKSIELSGLNYYMSRLPHGLETQVGEGGRFLSGGQRQAVAIARALYREPALLVMDEPTSSLDRNAEAALFNSLQLLPRHVTMVISSHKHTFLSLCDRIVVLDKGVVIAQGSPKEILSAQEKNTRTNRVRAVSIVREGGKA